MTVKEETVENDTPENRRRIADLEARARQDDDKNERAQAEARLFDPQELIQEADDLGTIQDEVLGVVRFGRLTLKEYRSFNTVTDPEERSYRILHAMLKKAYPTLKYEDVEKMPFDKLARLSSLLSSEITRFLLKPR